MRGIVAHSPLTARRLPSVVEPTIALAGQAVSMYTSDVTIDVHLCRSTRHEALGQFPAKNGATMPLFFRYDDWSIDTSFSERREALWSQNWSRY